MATQNLIPLLIILVSAILACVEAQTSDQPSWAKRNETEKEVITTLQFYFHDVVSGPNPTAIRIAQAASTNASSYLFGALWMIDDPLTVGPGPSSKLIGRARGLYGSVGQTDWGLIMALSYVFTDGIYDGSSFSLLGFNPVTKSGREMAVVGGTGLFRLARGYAIANTYQANANGDAIVGYNVTIVTYV
ncbi:dirigent protein 23-like [Salvia miltiorrhiza]|uniref:dirigent protein 23-like n=1 Tax=Salvia miltiorrhiza TaxID=226208 RepID=UPI0025AC4811|nr:dirigent protein 23-like [Salvia miltiorrhiza]